MMIHVYAGPSCPEPATLPRRPDLTWHPPVRHGDLLSSGIGTSDVVVLIDGAYHHGLAVRHKEILDILARRVVVLGAASMGALRAAELTDWGMIGVGQIFRWYRDGVFDGDDAVSVAHRTADPAIGTNVALVNLYAALLAGRQAGVIDAAAARDLLAALAGEYYPQRTRDRVLEIAGNTGHGAFAEWYRGCTAVDPHAFDQKRADARAAIDLANRLSGAAASRWATRAVDAGASHGRDWRTEYHRRWRNRFAIDPGRPTPQHRLTYRQIFEPRFPAVWWRYLHQAFDRAGPARQGGLRRHLVEQLGPAAESWLDDEASHDRITDLLCPTPDLTDPRQAHLLLGDQPQADIVLVADWLRHTAAHLAAHPERSLLRIPDEVCARLLRGIWQTGGDLSVECGRRGFASPRQAADAIRPFAIGFLSSRSRRDVSDV